MAHYIAVLKQEEGLVDGLPDTPGLDAYLCPANYATIGYGHVVLDPHSGDMLYAAPGLRKAHDLYPAGITEQQAIDLLAKDVLKYAAAVDRLGAKLTANQRSALICLCFNIGVGNFRTSSAARMAFAGKHAQVPDCIRKWNKAKKSKAGPLVVVTGLVIRREIEARLYATPDDAPFDPLAIRKEMEAKLGVGR